MLLKKLGNKSLVFQFLRETEKNSMIVCTIESYTTRYCYILVNTKITFWDYIY